MAEENKHGMTDAQNKLESSKTHARKAAEDLRDAAGRKPEVLSHLALQLAVDDDATGSVAERIRRGRRERRPRHVEEVGRPGDHPHAPG